MTWVHACVSQIKGKFNWQGLQIFTSQMIWESSVRTCRLAFITRGHNFKSSKQKLWTFSYANTLKLTQPTTFAGRAYYTSLVACSVTAWGKAVPHCIYRICLTCVSFQVLIYPRLSVIHPSRAQSFHRLVRKPFTFKLNYKALIGWNYRSTRIVLVGRSFVLVEMQL